MIEEHEITLCISENVASHNYIRQQFGLIVEDFETALSTEMIQCNRDSFLAIIFRHDEFITIIA